MKLRLPEGSLSTGDPSMPLDCNLHDITSHLSEAKVLLLSILRGDYLGDYLDLPYDDKGTILMFLGEVKRYLRALGDATNSLDAVIRSLTSSASPKSVEPAKSSDNLTWSSSPNTETLPESV